MLSSRAWFITAVATLFAVVGATYSNHFDNTFHFDDWHTISENPWIRDISNVPRFFSDGRTMSSLPANQSYRPLLTTSLALDYYLGGGLKPISFHTSTFAAFLLLLGLLYTFFVRLMNSVEPHARNRYLGLFATALFGLHPVASETINYVIQRADLYVALFLIASLLIYARWPALRSRGVYAIPVVPAMLFKPSAVMIAGVVIAYAVVVDRANRGKLLRECLPVVLATAAMLGLIAAKTPASHTTGGTAFANYVATQPRVAMHYVSSFVAPLALSVDTDRKPVDTLTSDTALIGYVFLAGLLWVTLLCSRQSAMRPAGFGLWLFLIALLPTSLVPLAEVENDHRMFAAFLGLAMAVTWSAWRCLETLSRRALALRFMQPAAVLSAALILSAAAFATHERNEVWRTEESLWLDATLKSPGNGRAHMNYALTQMQKGQYERALVSFNKALQLTPNYPILEINLGIVHGELGRRSEAEQHFRRALALAPSDSMPLFYFGRWLRREARVGEAEQMLRASIDRNTLYAQPRELLLDLYRESSRWSEVKALALDTLQYLPDNRKAGEALAVAARPPAAPQPTPEQLLQLSLVHHQGRRFKQCIDAARQALRLRPNFPEAYNNIAAAYEGLEMWDEAIEAARQALKLRPDYTLARNNLLYSQSQKSRAAAQRQSD